MDDLLDLYKNIKKRRLELKLSQEELANKVGYKDRTSIAKIETGKIDLPQSKIIDFADALGVTPSYLMGWEEDVQDYTPPQTIAAHATEDLTDEEQEKVREYIQFLKMKRGL